jgi:hypothetical protein
MTELGKSKWGGNLAEPGKLTSGPGRPALQLQALEQRAACFYLWFARRPWNCRGELPTTRALALKTQFQKKKKDAYILC